MYPRHLNQSYAGQAQDDAYVIPRHRTHAPQGVEFISTDLYDLQACSYLRHRFYKEPTLNTVFIGRMFDRTAMSRKHAKLTFGNSQVYLSDEGSAFGTYMETNGEKFPLYSLNNSPRHYQLHDGDFLIFGSRNFVDEHSETVVRVKVKLLYMLPGLDTASHLPHRRFNQDSQVNRDRHEVYHRASLPALSLSTSRLSLNPRLDSSGAKRRTIYHDGVTPLPTLSTTTSQLHLKPLRDSTTDLQRELKISWGDTFQLGEGIDAPSGEPRSCALAKVELAVDSSYLIADETTGVDILEWQNMHTIREEIELEGGLTINAAPPVAVGTKIASFMDKHSEDSYLTIQYRVDGSFGAEFLHKPRLNRHARRLNDRDEEFRQKYGDYYIAGYQRGYSCRIIVVCVAKDLSDTVALELEAQALVTNYFKAKARREKTNTEAHRCYMLRAFMSTWGYTCGDISIPPTGGEISLDRALDVLQHIRARPHGLPRTALLRHYSWIEGVRLSGTIDVGRDIFNQLFKMRQLYAKLQLDLLHPALFGYREEQGTESMIHLGMEEFKASRASLARNNADNARKRNEVHHQLKEAKTITDTLIRRYDFRNAIRGKDRRYTLHRPTGGPNDRRFRWECGTTGGTIESWEGGYGDAQRVVFDSGDEAYEYDWWSPITQGGTLGLFAGPSRSMELRMQNADTREGTSVMHHRRRHHGHRPKAVGFRHRIIGQPMYIIGWTLSCDWHGRKDPKIVVANGSLDNCIMAGALRIQLDTSVATSWHCRVTFVLQADYDFA